MSDEAEHMDLADFRWTDPGTLKLDPDLTRRMTEIQLAEDLSKVPGALDVYLRRELPNGGTVIFEHAPAGWLTQKGEVRYKDYRAYYFQATQDCQECDGGRIPSEKRPGKTVQCPACKGSGECRRQRFQSVTTILDGVLPKPGLAPWSEARGIEGVIEALRVGAIDFDTSPEEAIRIVRFLNLGADRARDQAAQRGLNVHALLETFMETGQAPKAAEHPVEHHGYVHALNAWLLDRNPEPVAVEQLVCHTEAQYAGRRDLVARSGGQVIGFDAKTQENGGIYSSAHIQLRLYEEAAIHGGDDPSDRLVVVVFAADGSYREMNCMATAETAEKALRFAADVKPIESECSGLNLAARRGRENPNEEI